MKKKPLLQRANERIAEANIRLAGYQADHFAGRNDPDRKKRSFVDRNMIDVITALTITVSFLFFTAMGWIIPRNIVGFIFVLWLVSKIWVGRK